MNHTSAIKIQAVYKGYKTRIKLRSILNDIKQEFENLDQSLEGHGIYTWGPEEHSLLRNLNRLKVLGDDSENYESLLERRRLILREMEFVKSCLP
ncbi:hypothetical protein HK099_004729 [Clydaea vesicula]|uniref:Uncharacterized protein n=1 Tax=Clydaea vesicula TaxID=447962 RepID=A0AAD5XVE8_9FUNG|nr:hypothetical protein HK099_004729 [Clydaea vesicula]KAJ3383754.1 hypothetical protein HDU92_003948 [Lobulomyces angularis]